MVYIRPIPVAAALLAVCSCPAGAPNPVETPDRIVEALVRYVRIGFVRPSGDIVWPVETGQDSSTRFAPPLWSQERESKRTRWDPDLPADHEPVVEGPLRLPIGAAVAVLHDGRRFEAIIKGLTVLRAGCGQAEPGWRARIVEGRGSPSRKEDAGLDDPLLWSAPDEPRSFPVLVSFDGPTLQPPVAAVDDHLPADLLVALAEQDLLEGERRSLRTDRLWTVYGTRTIDAHGRQVGSLRSTWTASKGGYRRLTVDDATNPTYEEKIIKWVLHHQSYHFDSFVGQVHAMFEHGGRVFFLSRYLGWESEQVLLEEPRADALAAILHDGLDRGC